MLALGPKDLGGSWGGLLCLASWPSASLPPVGLGSLSQEAGQWQSLVQGPHREVKFASVRQRSCLVTWIPCGLPLPLLACAPS